MTNLITVSRMVARSAVCREESRGAHYREDFPETDNRKWLVNIFLRKEHDSDMELTKKPVVFSRFEMENIEDQYFERVKE